MAELKLNLDPTPPTCRVVVRVTTSYYESDCGLHIRKDIKWLKRKCINHNFVKEDASCIGAEDTIKLMTNLAEVDDGIYEIVTINESYDRECNCLDSWEFKLVPYVEEK